MTDGIQKLTLQSARLYSLLGAFLFFVFILGVGGWGMLASFSGAVIARGLITVDTESKKVQSPLAGVIADLRVRNGDSVRAGDLLLRLDETLLRSNLDGVLKSLSELRIRRARLLAERDGLSTFEFRDEDQIGLSFLSEAVSNERILFQLRYNTRVGRKAQIEERIIQFAKEAEGLIVQIGSVNEQKVFIKQELDGIRYLWEQKLVPLSRLSALERESSRLNGSQGQLVASLAQVEGKITEAKLALAQIDADLFSEVSNEQREIDAKIAPLEEQLAALRHQLSMVSILAPQDGVVHQISVRANGGVVSVGENLMIIVPTNEPLFVEAQVNPTDVDQLLVGSTVFVRFAAFNQRTTPEVSGFLTSVSPDITIDQRSGGSFYSARISLPLDELKKIIDGPVVPGMPVEVFIKTGDRRVVDIVVKPISDQLFRAYRQN